jgi:Ca2+-binding EF-hand superfamily protein
MMSGVSGMSGMMPGMRPDPQEMFNRMDTDGSAGIDADELSSAMEKMAEHSGNSIDAESLMAEFDEDGDGVLNEEETHNAMESLKEQMGPPPPMGGPMAMGDPPCMGGCGRYDDEAGEAQSLVDQMLASLSESSESEDTAEVLQEWLQTLNGDTPSYAPIDTQN